VVRRQLERLQQARRQWPERPLPVDLRPASLPRGRRGPSSRSSWRLAPAGAVVGCAIAVETIKPMASAATAETRAIIIFPLLLTDLRMITFAFPILGFFCRCGGLKIRIRL